MFLLGGVDAFWGCTVGDDQANQSGNTLRIKSPNQTEPFPSTVSSAWFRSLQVAFATFDLDQLFQARSSPASLTCCLSLEVGCRIGANTRVSDEVLQLSGRQWIFSVIARSAIGQGRDLTRSRTLRCEISPETGFPHY